MKASYYLLLELITAIIGSSFFIFCNLKALSHALVNVIEHKVDI